jgi:hypothetical protein
MIRALALLLAIPLLGVATPVVAQSQPSDSDIQQVQRALNRGTLIYYYDQAAWHGTDDMVAKLHGKQIAVAGWIVDGTPTASEITFYANGDGGPRAVYVAQFSGTELVSGKLLGPGDDTSISPRRLAMIAAKDKAAAALEAAGVQRCSNKRFNTVVLPPETPGGPTLVYFLTPQTSNDSVPMGGHYLVPIAADGSVGKIRAFTKSCAEMPFRGGKEGKPVALVFTHLLDPVPTEIHVFTVFSIEIPLFVQTTQNERLWAVEIKNGRARIRNVEDQKKY